MSPIQEAIVLLVIARDKLETELHHRGADYEETMSPDNQDLADVSVDLSTIIYTLESFGNTRALTHDEIVNIVGGKSQ